MNTYNETIEITIQHNIMCDFCCRWESSVK